MRLIFTLVIAALEATFVSLPLMALTTLNSVWSASFAVVALGWLSELVATRLPTGRQRFVLGAGALVVGLLLPVTQFGGLPITLTQLLPGSPRFTTAYFLLLVGLFLFWRGTRIDSGAGADVGTLFGRGAAVALTALILGSLFGTGAPAGSPDLLAQVVALGSLGLTALALAHTQNAAGDRLAGLNWRWLVTLLGAVVVVVALATVATGLLGGGDSLTAAEGLLGVLLLPLALIGGLIAWLVFTFLAEPLAWLIRSLAAALQGIRLLEDPPTAESTPALGNDAPLVTIQRLAEGATFLMALIPVVILVAVILLLRRRRRQAGPPDEERESLGLLASLGSDLRDLLGRLRNPFVQPLRGLQAALAALQGDDATSRVRRAYLRLLVLLEARGSPRPTDKTPFEYEPVAAAAVEAPEPVARLTAAYTQARYNPGGATTTDAERAEAALGEVHGRQ